MENVKNYKLVPTFGNSFGTGFQVMLDNFLRLLLVVFVLAILTAPFSGFNYKFDAGDFPKTPFEWGHMFGNDLQGLFAVGALGMLGIFRTARPRLHVPGSTCRIIWGRYDLCSVSKRHKA